MPVDLIKFDRFTKDVLEAKHDFSSHGFKLMLSNTPPLATNTIKADITEIAAGNGYTAGGALMTIFTNTTGGVTEVGATNIVFAASGGSIGPFRYFVMYNDTTLNKPLVAWWDYGSSISLLPLESFTFAPDPTNGLFQLS